MCWHKRGADKTVLAMAEDWELFTQNAPTTALGFDYEESRRYAAFYRASIEQEMHTRFMSEPFVDCLTLADQVQAPTLVIRHTGVEWLSMDSTRELVNAIPGARMVAIEGGYSDHPREAARAILQFLAGYAPARHQRPAVEQRSSTGSPSTAIILFADIADSTALTERLGDAAFRAKARDLDAALRAVIREHTGTPIEGKLLGDGVLAVFTSARQAIEGALACGAAGDDAGLPLHLGLHAGDVIREDNNVYGGAVNIASRISVLSAPGEVLVSDIVRGLARTSAGVRFEDRGEQSLKGIGEPVRVWAVRSDG